VKPGDAVTAHQPFGTIEAVKAVSELFSPVTGEVVEGNGALDGDPAGNSPYAAAILRHLGAIEGQEFGIVLRMIGEVDSPHLKACLDAPLAAKQGVTSMQDAAREVAGLQVLSHFGGEYERAADGSVRGLVRNPDETLTPENYYLDFALGMQEIGYDGYIGYELCHPIPDVNGIPVGIDFADLNARLAAEYMREVLKEAATAAVAKTV